jgi:hypothetical protein
MRASISGHESLGDGIGDGRIAKSSIDKAVGFSYGPQADGRIRPFYSEVQPGRHTAMHAIDRRILQLFRVLVVGLGLSNLVFCGCKSGESWAPKLPTFGGSNLVFGSKSKDEIAPPAMSFKPGEATKPSTSGNPSQLASNSMNSGSSSSATPPRAPYSFREPNTAATNTLDSVAGSPPSRTPATNVDSNPPAAALGQLPANPGGVSQVGYDRTETPRSGTGTTLGGFNESVVNSPLLPSGQDPSSQRNIRGIPGGSLGNPLGGSSGMVNNSPSTSRLPSLPPSPSADVSTTTSAMSGSPTSGMSSTSSAMPATSSAAGLSAAANRVVQSTPPSAQLPGLPSPGLTSPSLPHAGLPNAGVPGPNLVTAGPTAPNQTAIPAATSSSGFRPGSVGAGQSATSPASPGTSNYRQTQHGAYPGLPAWPGGNATSSPTGSATPAGFTQPSSATPANDQRVLPSLPGSASPPRQQPTSGTSALPSFPGAAQAAGQVVCDGDQCVVR